MNEKAHFAFIGSDASAAFGAGGRRNRRGRDAGRRGRSDGRFRRFCSGRPVRLHPFLRQSVGKRSRRQQLLDHAHGYHQRGSRLEYADGADHRGGYRQEKGPEPFPADQAEYLHVSGTRQEFKDRRGGDQPFPGPSHHRRAGERLDPRPPQRSKPGTS